MIPAGAILVYNATLIRGTGSAESRGVAGLESQKISALGFQDSCTVYARIGHSYRECVRRYRSVPRRVTQSVRRHGGEFGDRC